MDLDEYLRSLRDEYADLYGASLALQPGGLEGLLARTRQQLERGIDALVEERSITRQAATAAVIDRHRRTARRLGRRGDLLSAELVEQVSAAQSDRLTADRATGASRPAPTDRSIQSIPRVVLPSTSQVLPQRGPGPDAQQLRRAAASLVRSLPPGTTRVALEHALQAGERHVSDAMLAGLVEGILTGRRYLRAYLNLRGQSDRAVAAVAEGVAEGVVAAGSEDLSNRSASEVAKHVTAAWLSTHTPLAPWAALYGAAEDKWAPIVDLFQATPLQVMRAGTDAINSVLSVLFEGPDGIRLAREFGRAIGRARYADLREAVFPESDFGVVAVLWTFPKYLGPVFVDMLLGLLTSGAAPLYQGAGRQAGRQLREMLERVFAGPDRSRLDRAREAALEQMPAPAGGGVGSGARRDAPERRAPDAAEPTEEELEAAFREWESEVEAPDPDAAREALTTIVLTAAQRMAAGRLFGQRLPRVFRELWDASMTPALREKRRRILRLLTEGRRDEAYALARKTYNRMRENFWARVRDNETAMQMLEQAGLKFAERDPLRRRRVIENPDASTPWQQRVRNLRRTAPFYRSPDGRTILVTLEHVLRVIDQPDRAIRGENLLMALPLENSVVLERLRGTVFVTRPAGAIPLPAPSAP